MKYSAHFICLNATGIKGLGDNHYTSEAWDIPVDDAEKILNGNVYFHTTKNEKSYFGGVVTKYEVIEIDASHSKRIKIFLTSNKEAKGIAWDGKGHGMAWYSGLVKVDI